MPKSKACCIILYWLAEVTGYPSKAFYKLCKVELGTHKNDLKKSMLLLTNKHINKLKEVESLVNSQPIAKAFKPRITKLQQVAEIRAATFVAKHTALMSKDHLMLLMPSIFPDSKIATNLSMHRTKCTGLIKNLIGRCLVKELLEDVGDSFYSLIIDESTDISQKKLLAVFIRYFSKTKCKIITTFLAFVVTSFESTSDAIGSCIVTMLQKYKLSLEKLIGIGVDGCSTMIGAKHSVSTYFKQIVPDIVMFKCVCHNLQLAASKASLVMPAHINCLIR